MKSITFHCEVITPMFLAGADGRTPELRPPSIKGALRFWWRALNGHRSIRDLKAREGEIFGNTERQSGFYIEVLSQPENVGEKPLVPHKHFTAPAFLPGSTFSIRMVNRTLDEREFRNVANLFVLLSFLGGLGKRSRRGMGAFKINSYELKDIDFSLPEVSLQNILNLINNFSGHYILINDKIVFNYQGRTEQYPFVRTITISKTSVNNPTYKISLATHEVKGKVGYFKYEPNLGYTKGGRFASPVYVSVVENNYIVISQLATFPKRGQANVSFHVQELFINKLL